MGEYEKPNRPTVIENRKAEVQRRIEGYDEILESLQAGIDEVRALKDEEVSKLDRLNTYRYAGPPPESEV